MLPPDSVQRTAPLGSPLGRGRRLVSRVGSLTLLSLRQAWPCRMRAAGRVRGSRSPEQWPHSTLWVTRPDSGPHWPRLSSGLAGWWLGQELVLESFEAGNVGVLTERFVGHGEEVSEAL